MSVCPLAASGLAGQLWSGQCSLGLAGLLLRSLPQAVPYPGVPTESPAQTSLSSKGLVKWSEQLPSSAWTTPCQGHFGGDGNPEKASSPAGLEGEVVRESFLEKVAFELSNEGCVGVCQVKDGEMGGIPAKDQPEQTPAYGGQ